MTRLRLEVARVNIGGPWFACCRRPHTTHIVDYEGCDCLRTELPIGAQAKSSGRLATDHESMARDGRVAGAREAVERYLPDFLAAWDASETPAETHAHDEIKKPRVSGKSTPETSTKPRAQRSNKSPGREAQKANKWNKNQASGESFTTNRSEPQAANTSQRRGPRSSRLSATERTAFRSASSTPRDSSSISPFPTAPSRSRGTGTGLRGSDHGSKKRSNRHVRNGQGRAEGGLHGAADRGPVQTIQRHEPPRPTRSTRAESQTASREKVGARKQAPCFDGGLSNAELRGRVSAARKAGKLGAR